MQDANSVFTGKSALASPDRIRLTSRGEVKKQLALWARGRA